MTRHRYVIAALLIGPWVALAMTVAIALTIKPKTQFVPIIYVPAAEQLTIGHSCEVRS
jgi:predicted membrane protein